MKVKVEMNNRETIIDAERIDGNAPMDTIISALTACTTISIVTILKRMHENFIGISTKVKWDQEQEPPRIFKKIDLEYIVKGEVSESGMKKALELTFKKYSPSAVILQRAGLEINASFKIEQ
ncbi:MAG: OsmC family protein [Thermoplasmata archaeon]